MIQIDVFNGDADGICALHQFRLSEPAESLLITDIKQQVQLVGRVFPTAPARVNVMDVSLDANRAAVMRLLAGGVEVWYFDHHFAGEIPEHPGFHSHIDTASDTCTSLLMNRYLGGKQARWAVAGAFGDNMEKPALAVAGTLGLNPDELDACREAGTLLNYNGYGNDLTDLHFHPVDLYQAVKPFDDPVQFMKQSEAAGMLREKFAVDLKLALGQTPMLDDAAGKVFMFPNETWAQRISGVFANRIAAENPALATAVGVERENGSLRMSVRAPLEKPEGADALCRRFPTGGGRKGAAAVNVLPLSQLPVFLDAFRETFAS